LLEEKTRCDVFTARRYASAVYDKLYSPEMVVTVYKYSTENDLRKEKRKEKTHK